MSVDVPNFRMLGTLGTGQGSTLFKAKNVLTGAFYTIKHVKDSAPDFDRLVDQMRNEHACGSSMDHPVLRKTYELRYVRHRLRIKAALLFMEFVEGRTLSEMIGEIESIRLMRIMEQAADGIHAMHQAGYVHADIKPGNILITPEGPVKLIDYGQSSTINKAKERVQGTRDYIAPEQTRLQVLDARTDVFGLGATLHRVLTGRAITTEMNVRIDLSNAERLNLRSSEDVATPLAALPPVIRKLITDCCATDPDKRIQTMADFIDRCQMARMILNRRPRANKASTAADTATDPANDGETAEDSASD